MLVLFFFCRNHEEKKQTGKTSSAPLNVTKFDVHIVPNLVLKKQNVSRSPPMTWSSSTQKRVQLRDFVKVQKYQNFANFHQIYDFLAWRLQTCFSNSLYCPHLVRGFQIQIKKGFPTRWNIQCLKTWLLLSFEITKPLLTEKSTFA